MNRALLVVALFLASLNLACATGDSGCGLHPKSDPLRVGETASVQIDVPSGGWRLLGPADMAGGYWVTDEGAPRGVVKGTTLTGQARRVSRSRIDVDFGDHGVVTFTGPIGCK